MIDGFSGDFLQWLRGFYFVAQTKSFSRAGDLMERNQSSITYQLKRLEKELGVTLVNRDVIPLELTPVGEQLFTMATGLFEQLQQIKTEIAVGDTLKGNITITANYGVASYYLPQHIKAFKKICPEVQIDVFPERTAFVQESYLTNASDFVIAQRDLLPEDAIFNPLFETDLALITPKNFHYDISFPFDFKELASLPIVGFVRELPIDHCVLQALEKEHLTLNVVQYAGFFLTVLMYVSLGMGVSVLDEVQAYTPGFAVEVHSLHDVFPRRVYGLAWRPRHYLTPQAQRFKKYLLHESDLKSRIPHLPQEIV